MLYVLIITYGRRSAQPSLPFKNVCDWTNTSCDAIVDAISKRFSIRFGLIDAFKLFYVIKLRLRVNQTIHIKPRKKKDISNHSWLIVRHMIHHHKDRNHFFSEFRTKNKCCITCDNFNQTKNNFVFNWQIKFNHSLRWMKRIYWSKSPVVQGVADFNLRIFFFFLLK